MDDTVVFSVPWFDVVARKTRESEPPYYVLQTSDYVSVLALTEDGSVLLVQQYRPVVKSATLELPSGHVEGGESPEAAARRELAEETGYEANGLELLGILSPDTGRLGNKLWCFYTSCAVKMQSPVLREEGVQLVTCTPREMIRHVEEGSINHALTLAVLLLATLRRRLLITYND
jgi:8-oxo-dGTP pyrophosphatase MutT (NUDIX family)